MIYLVGWVLLGIVQVCPCSARDFIIEFEDENYKEEQKSFSYTPIIYHSIQVSTPAGSKLLVLTGDNYHYRRWLRQYIARGKSFIAKVPDEQTDQFITASAFDIDVTRLHPFEQEPLAMNLEKKSPAPAPKRPVKGTGLKQILPEKKSLKALTISRRD